jgi:hypothetical protein
MIIKNGKIIEASESELWQYYLERDLDDVYSFDDYFDRMKDAGVKIVEKPKPTNGDVIRQGGNRAIAKFAYKTARTHICGTCAFATIENGRYKCTAEHGQSCIDGIESWLNAPAESEGEDE